VDNRIPEFGAAASGAIYTLRPGGYAVIFDDAGNVAVVSAPQGLALPGGGQEGAESPADAAFRETREECGLRITVGQCIGVADELVFTKDENAYYRKRCTFFLAKAVEKVGVGESDHELLWLPPENATATLVHESQRWAVSAACRSKETSDD
jgi:8-oxo-dGTP diphosphatase